MSSDSKHCPLQKLVDSFCLLLDESLIVAIANDYDLSEASSYKSAYTILQDLAQNVLSEEASGFNPSAANCFSGEELDACEGDALAGRTSISERTSRDQITDSSNTSQVLSTESGNSIPHVDLIGHESEETKFQQLQGLFPDMKAYDVKYSLIKAKFDFQTALDDLLNIQYLQSTGQQAKGIDIFFQPKDLSTGSKKKKKKKKGQSSVDHSSQESSSRASPSCTDEFKNQSEMAYLAERFNISLDEVSAFSYGANCSIIATMIAILDQHISHGESRSLDEDEKVAIENLRRRYPHIPDKYIQAIVETTGTVPRFTDDIASLANKHFKGTKKQRLNFNYQLAPSPASEMEEAGSSVNGKKPSRECSGQMTPTTSSRGIKDFSQALQASEAHHQARRDAMASAASLYRKGASNPLYRQAASVYTERAHEQADYAQEATSIAADLLVEGQSTKDTVDLHGVTVYDGVRIARQKTLSWWEGNRSSIRGEKRQLGTLTIITGLGRHSAGGVSQLRKSVAAALLQDGWKIRVETGKFVITGRQSTSSSFKASINMRDQLTA